MEGGEGVYAPLRLRGARQGCRLSVNESREHYPLSRYAACGMLLNLFDGLLLVVVLHDCESGQEACCSSLRGLCGSRMVCGLTR